MPVPAEAFHDKKSKTSVHTHAGCRDTLLCDELMAPKAASVALPRNLACQWHSMLIVLVFGTVHQLVNRDEFLGVAPESLASGEDKMVQCDSCWPLSGLSHHLAHTWLIPSPLPGTRRVSGSRQLLFFVLLLVAHRCASAAVFCVVHFHPSCFFFGAFSTFKILVLCASVASWLPLEHWHN